MDGERDEATDLSQSADGTLVERRQVPRIEVTLHATCRRLGRQGEGEETTTVDVSHGGARISAPTQVNVGDVVQLTVEMPHGIELTLQGLVVQLSPAGEDVHAHVAFDSLSTAAADLLTELLKDQGEWSNAGPDRAPAPDGDPPGAGVLS